MYERNERYMPATGADTKLLSDFREDQPTHTDLFA